MNPLSDAKAEAITVFLVEDDAPTFGGCRMRWPRPDTR